MDRTAPHRRVTRRVALPVVALSVVATLVVGSVGPARADRIAGPESAASTGTTLPPGPIRVAAQQVAEADQPIALVPRVGDDAMYVVEKEGRIRILRDGAIEPGVVLDIRARVDSTNERGLLGLAFPPKRDDVLYLDWVDLRGHVIISELPFDGQKADMSRERRLLDIPKPFNEHNAGSIFFGTDGMLYIPIGDGGGGGDPLNNAQRTDVLLGKILRIDPRPSATLPYTIPPDNPFAGPGTLGAAKKGRGEVWAYGLRNPWRAGIDPATGDLWIPDVGQSSREEINRMPAGTKGTNFGWRLREGTNTFKGPRPARAVDPVYDYPHADGRCAVTGGAVYRGTAMPALVGSYVFADLCSGRIMALQPTKGRWRAVDLGTSVSYLAAFGVGLDREIWVLSLEGAIGRLVPA